MKVELIPLTSDDREQFILDNQEAFNFGAMEEFGMRDNPLEEDGNIISRKTIEECIDGGEAYRIVCENKKVGGVIVKVKGKKGSLEIYPDPKEENVVEKDDQFSDGMFRFEKEIK